MVLNNALSGYDFPDDTTYKVGTYILSIDAFIKDAKAHNEVFLNILKEGFKSQKLTTMQTIYTLSTIANATEKKLWKVGEFVFYVNQIRNRIN